jgi:hypothetical protein
MKKINVLFWVISICTINSIYGQITCSENDLIGQWKQVKYIYGKEAEAIVDLRNYVLRSDVDSLKKIAQDSSFASIICEFKNNFYIITYTYLSSGETKKYHKPYTFNQTRCEIYLKKKKKIIKSRYSASKLNIVYLDKQLLVIRKWHHKFGDVIEVYHKKE